MKKLQFNSTSSHGYWSSVNRDTIKSLNDYFFRNIKSNIFYKYFNTETVYFLQDEGTGSINIGLHYCEYDDWVDTKKMWRLIYAIVKKIDNQGDELIIQFGNMAYNLKQTAIDKMQKSKSFKSFYKN